MPDERLILLLLSCSRRCSPEGEHRLGVVIGWHTPCGRCTEGEGWFRLFCLRFSWVDAEGEISDRRRVGFECRFRVSHFDGGFYEIKGRFCFDIAFKFKLALGVQGCKRCYYYRFPRSRLRLRRRCLGWPPHQTDAKRGSVLESPSFWRAKGVCAPRVASWPSQPQPQPTLLRRDLRRLPIRTASSLVRVIVMMTMIRVRLTAALAGLDKV